MKLRIRGNSVRLRLTRTEVGSLVDDGEVVERVDFAGQPLHYRLVRDAYAGDATASFDGAGITVSLPAATVDHWATHDAEISIESQQALQDGALRILVEKDFACLQPRTGEDDSDMFAHPDADRLTC